MIERRKPKVLVFIVAYNAEKTIRKVVHRIPAGLLNTYDVDVLIIDDSSRDATFEKGHSVSKEADLPFPITVLFNPRNQGYGGNQKLGYHYALERGYDFVALIHGDGQYAPECLPELLEPLRKGEAGAVFGSRMMTPSGARSGGMPLYKLAGNKILTWIENKLLRANLSEFHSGYRIYSTRALAAIPFDRNANDFHFDTEIIIQLLVARQRIKELPIPTYYGDEICYVNGMKYAFNVVAAALRARLQEMGLFYERKFDCAPGDSLPYVPKFNYVSPHSLAFERIRPGSGVLDIGCAGGYMGSYLVQQKQCHVDGIDAFPIVQQGFDAFYLHDLNLGLPRLNYEKYNYALMLDVIEHLAKPEAFLEQLRVALSLNPSTEVMLSTANIGFLVTRFMLLLGQFNYGKRGVLDLTHTRLFTCASFERAVKQAGFDIVERIGVPAPAPLAIGDNFVSRMCVAINRALIRISRGMFSYQIFLRVRPQPTVEYLLKTAQEQSQKRAQALETAQSMTSGD
ncbi:MAG TPA: bifunctional glycosyltransferase/class I SAM-dependent methyltransferase [Bryobacteraceae bacterium]|nr:bifunctional glycosyltransferase/class I SAM-dependent methyltransferase [Bryobacteraceae bacterium]